MWTTVWPAADAMWPNARASVMGGEQAATVLTLVREEQLAKKGLKMTEAEIEAFKNPIRADYDRQGRPAYSVSVVGRCRIGVRPHA